MTVLPSAGEERVALYAGSFDPITHGHEDLIQRTFAFADRLIVAVATNVSKQMAKQRAAMLFGLIGVLGDAGLKEVTYADVLYERSGYTLPEDLQVGDRLEIASTGAYTTTYAAVAFNGFEPLRSYYV